MTEASPKLENYFESLSKGVEKAYSLSEKARQKGYDPEDHVSIPIAKNMAERVEGLISVKEPKIKNSGISKRITELEQKFGKLSWKVALTIALETANEKFCKFENQLKAMELGIRTGLAYLTLGVVASPLEGFVELKLKKRRDDNKEYFCLMFSGPIRSAGGTAAAVSVLVADYIRKKMGYAQYDPTDNEVLRSSTELYDYHERITNLQYLPSKEEIEFMAKHMPIQIDGDASEKIEVSNYKDLPRIETNIIRNGFCLVMGECLCQKSQKLQKQLVEWGEEFEMQQWFFLNDFVKLQKTKKAGKKADGKIQPDYTYIKDLVAGRPILGFPLRNGSFRLRYGRGRNTGYSSTAIHPATTYILDRFIAVGTQLKLERPGKAASISTVDSIDGPIVKLKSGEVLQVNDISVAKQITKQVSEILYLGDMLINYGDFFNRAHVLVPPGYCEEWWTLELANRTQDSEINEFTQDPFQKTIKAKKAIYLSEKYSIPLHPIYTYFWNTLKTKETFSTLKQISSSNIVKTDNIVEKIIINYNEEIKRNLELLAIPHKFINNEYIVIETEHATILDFLIQSLPPEFKEFEDSLSLINSFSKIKIKDKAGTFIGARMGRPEKAKVRKLTGQPHCLFPVGDEGGRLRSFQAAIDIDKITSDFPMYKCKCGNETVFKVCEKCNKKTKKIFHCRTCGPMEKDTCSKHGLNQTFKNQPIQIKELFNNSAKLIKITDLPDLIKGVRGTTNKDHVPEHLSKGILRAKHTIPVNKDGTTRYDMTQLAITHFKPKEITTTIEKLREIGYTKDIEGNSLIDDNQVLELLPQDLILPRCIGSMEEGADEVLFRVANFVDELLVRLYQQETFYNAKIKEDLVGQLIVALAPHTSAGIVGRILGFSKTQGFYAHPMFHAATRRDCDGDEACVTLLVDALLNFSRQYLPNTRGATQDAPLVLTSQLTPSEVDDMVFDIDIASTYSLNFYDSANKFKMPWDVKVTQIGDNLNTPLQYEGMSFTHPTNDINEGVKCSAYKLLPSMQEKLHGQMDLALKIRAVDEAQVAKTVIEKHFIKDIKGNLRKFSQQQFRCVGCNEKFRRPPLKGNCTACGGKIIFTISEGSIVKYLEPALSLATHYNLPNYLKQTLELSKRRVESIFGRDKEKQEGLGKWFG